MTADTSTSLSAGTAASTADHDRLAPGECLIQHRMHHAVHLLNNRNLTISQIAAQVGYDDLFHFSKMFKKQFGLSPARCGGGMGIRTH